MTAQYAEKKHCCTVCDAKRKCHVCGDQTQWACADCAISFGATVYVCGKTTCRDAHDQAAIDHVTARSLQVGSLALSGGSGKLNA